MSRISVRIMTMFLAILAVAAACRAGGAAVPAPTLDESKVSTQGK